MALKRRIDRLESRARVNAASAPCALCGHRAGEPLRVAILGPPVVATIDELDRGAAEQPGDRCAQCRRKTVFRIPPPLLARAG